MRTIWLISAGILLCTIVGAPPVAAEDVKEDEAGTDEPKTDTSASVDTAEGPDPGSSCRPYCMS